MTIIKGCLLACPRCPSCREQEAENDDDEDNGGTTRDCPNREIMTKTVSCSKNRRWFRSVQQQHAMEKE